MAEFRMTTKDKLALASRLELCCRHDAKERLTGCQWLQKKLQGEKSIK